MLFDFEKECISYGEVEFGRFNGHLPRTSAIAAILHRAGENLLHSDATAAEFAAAGASRPVPDFPFGHRWLPVWTPWRGLRAGSAGRIVGVGLMKGVHHAQP
jgi:hypothetical protein